MKWSEIHGDDYRQAVAARDHFATETRNRLGRETTAEIQHHVDVALGRVLAADLQDLDPAADRAFHQLLALERAVLEIEGRIESKAVFFDPYNASGLFPVLASPSAKSECQAFSPFLTSKFPAAPSFSDVNNHAMLPRVPSGCRKHRTG